MTSVQTGQRFCTRRSFLKATSYSLRSLSSTDHCKPVYLRRFPKSMYVCAHKVCLFMMNDFMVVTNTNENFIIHKYGTYICLGQWLIRRFMLKDSSVFKKLHYQVTLWLLKCKTNFFCCCILCLGWHNTGPQMPVKTWRNSCNTVKIFTHTTSWHMITSFLMWPTCFFKTQKLAVILMTD